MDDNDFQPNMTTPAGMGGAMPDTATAAPVQPQVQQQAPPVDPAAVAQIQHDSAFGRMAKAILGQQNQYSVGPDGTLQNNPVPEKPGQLFRSILGAALLGGAAGANGNPAQGLAGGLVRGGAAGVQNTQQQDQQKQAQAQQDFKNQQLVNQQSRETQMANAQVANMHSEMVARDRRSDLEDQDAHDKHNAASAALETNLTAAGGTPAVIPVNGEGKSNITAPDLAAAYVKDPSILKGPPGFIRHFVDTTDSSELTYNGKNWVDASGEPVNMSDKTTVKAIDVPVDAMKTKIATTGKDINAAYGGKLVDPGQTYQMSPLDMDSLNTRRLKEARDQGAADLEKERVKQGESQIALQRGELGIKYKELADKENAAGTNADGYGPEQIADAIHQGRTTFEQATQGMGKESAAFRRQVEGVFLKKYPDANLEALKSYGKQAENSGTQTQLTNARSIFGANGQPGSFDTLEAALQAVPKSSTPWVSKLEQDTAYNLGSPQMATVKALKTDLGTELAKFNAGGGNATSDHQIELYREQLNEAQTPEQVTQVLKDIRNISSKRLGAIVGANPYLHNMTTDINDPVTKQPRGTQNANPQNGQPQQFSHVSASGKFGYDDKSAQWVPIPGK